MQRNETTPTAGVDIVTIHGNATIIAALLGPGKLSHNTRGNNDGALLDTGFLHRGILGASNQEPPKTIGDGGRNAGPVGITFVDACYAFGEFDIIVIADDPDNVSMAAGLIAIATGGAVLKVQTTPLLSVEEGIEAITRAGAVAYRPAGSLPAIDHRWTGGPGA